MQQLHKIGVGGGCHWCTEGVFISLRGVEQVEQGWIASPAPNDTFSEAIIVHYNSSIVSVEDLIAVHLETHASTRTHALREKYRSAIYAFSEDDAAHYLRILLSLAKDFTEPLITQVLAFSAFKASLPEHQDYYRMDPNRPFCQRFITPKLDRLRETKPSLLR